MAACPCGGGGTDGASPYGLGVGDTDADDILWSTPPGLLEGKVVGNGGLILLPPPKKVSV